jgi:DNA-binding NarL/FixJ family response regulator
MTTALNDAMARAEAQPAAQPVREVLIIEDQPEGRQFLRSAVALAFTTAHIDFAESLAAAMATLPRRYDLAVVDLRLGDGLGIAWVQRYRALHPDSWVVIATLFDDDELVFAALRAGVDGYVLKEQTAASIAQALTGLVRGESAISPRIARKMLHHFRGEAVRTLAPAPAVVPLAHEAEALTEREREVLSCIGQGLSIKQTAHALDIAYFTVNHHIKAVYRKLSIRTRAQAATEAAKRGLL